MQCSKRTAIDMICKRRSDTCMPSQASKNTHCIIYYVMHCITGLLQTSKSDGDESSMNLAKLEQRVTGYCLPVQQVLSRSAKTLYESCIDTVNYEAFFKGENSTCFCTVVHSLVFFCLFFCYLHVIKAGIGGTHTQYAFIITCASCWCISFIVALALTHGTVLQAHAVVLSLGSTLL